jgi:hypothetical protein
MDYDFLTHVHMIFWLDPQSVSCCFRLTQVPRFAQGGLVGRSASALSNAVGCKCRPLMRHHRTLCKRAIDYRSPLGGTSRHWRNGRKCAPPRPPRRAPGCAHLSTCSIKALLRRC